MLYISLNMNKSNAPSDIYEMLPAVIIHKKLYYGRDVNEALMRKRLANYDAQYEALKAKVAIPEGLEAGLREYLYMAPTTPDMRGIKAICDKYGPGYCKHFNLVMIIKGWQKYYKTIIYLKRDEGVYTRI